MIQTTTDLHTTEIDGVRCVWVETGRPTLTAMLTFRSGMADEPLHESGWQHLLEHLSLHDREHGTLTVNGHVDLLETSLHAHGPADLVSRHLADLTAWFAAPRFAELDRERRVLHAENAMRGSSQTHRALGWRYGARGPGVPGFGEPALGRATPDLLSDRIARTFTAGNAVLVLDGPPPTDLRLHLPSGAAAPWSVAVPCDDTVPARYVEAEGLVLSGVVPRSVATAMSAELLRQALTDRFRNQDGSAYAPWALYQRVDADHAVLLGGTDVQPTARERLAASSLDLVARLRRELPAPDRLEQLKASRLQAVADPYQRLGLAAYAAQEWHQDRDPKSLDEVLAEVRAVTAAEVRAGFAAFADSLLLGMPGDASWADQLPTLSAPAHAPAATGRSWRDQNWPSVRSRLVVSNQVVEVRQATQARSVRLPSLAAMLVFDNGVRHLVGGDGYGLTVDTRRWQDPVAVRAALDAAVPGPLRLPMLTSTEGDRPPVRLSAFRRWTGAIESTRPGGVRYRDTWALVLFLVIVGGCALLAAATHSLHASPALVLLPVLAIRVYQRMRGRRGW